MIFSIFDATLVEDFGDTYYYFVDEARKPLEHIESKTRLHFRVKPDQDEHISLSSGERLQDIDGRMNIYPQNECLQEGALGIGVMTFMSAKSREFPDPSSPARYFIEVKLPPPQFAGLVEAARNGRIPKSISVEARGMTLPDEFSSMWDVNVSPQLHVASISISIPLTVGETIIDGENLLASTQLQVLNLRQEMSLFVKGINAKLKWLLGMLIFLVVILTIFKH